MLHLKHARILTMGPRGVLEDADVLVDGGKIAALGHNLTAPGGARVMDLTGRVLMPGLVDAHAHRGGITMDGSFGDDLNECTAPVTAELSAYYAIRPDDPSFQEAAGFGITTSCVAPGSGNVVCGYAVAIKSAGKDLESRVIRNPVALKAAVGINPKSVYARKNVTPMSRMGIAQVLRDYLMKVREYMDKKAKAQGDPEKLPPYDEGMEHGIPVLEGRLPLKVHAYQHDMLTVLRIADEFNIDVTLDHAQGASDFLETMAESKHLRGVIYGPIFELFPGEGCKVDFDALMKLDALGVPTAVMTDAPVTYCQMLVNQTGEAVRAGMDPMRALRMITINPARIIGCEDRIGSIEPGKDADLVVFDGQPALDPTTRVMLTIIDGQVVYQR